MSGNHFQESEAVRIARKALEGIPHYGLIQKMRAEHERVLQVANPRLLEVRAIRKAFESQKYLGSVRFAELRALYSSDALQRINRVSRLLNYGYEPHTFGNECSSHTIVRKQPSPKRKRAPDRLTQYLIELANEIGTTNAHSLWLAIKIDRVVIFSKNTEVLEWETKPKNRCLKGKITKFRRSSLPSKVSNMKKNYGDLLP